MCTDRPARRSTSNVVYQRDPANLARIVQALAPIRPYLRGAPPGLPFRWDAATLRRGLNFTLTTEASDLDLLGEVVGGGTYDDLLAGSEPIDLGAASTPFQNRASAALDSLLTLTPDQHSVLPAEPIPQSTRALRGWCASLSE